MSEAISHATFMPHPPVRGAQRAPGGGDDGEKAFGDALDAPENRAEGKKVDDAHQGDAAETAADGEERSGDEERDDDKNAGRFVQILAMTGPGHWSFRFPADGTRGDGEANAAAATDGKKPAAAGGTGAHAAVEARKTATLPAQVEAATGDGSPGAEKAAARARMAAAANGEAGAGARADNARHAGQLAAVLGDAGPSNQPKAASHADTQARPASEARGGAAMEALQQQAGDNDDAAGQKSGRDGDGSGRGRAGLEAQAGDAAMPKVKVVGMQNAPAPAAAMPAAHGASQTGAELVKSLHADPAFRAAASDAASQANAGARPEVMHSLKLQLQPASMGTVTATLRLVGDHLAVELHADNASAHHRLATDSDTMVKALRALGYEVDRVTVHQAAPQHGTSAGTDGHAGSGARQSAFQSAGGNTGEGAASQGEERGHEGQHKHAGPDRGRAQGQADSSRNGLYI